MADDKVDGKDILLFIDPTGGTNYSLIVCLDSNGLNRSSSTVDASSKCGPDQRAGAQTVVIPFSGQLVYNADTDHLSEGALNDLWADSTLIGWKVARATPVDGDEIYSGQGTITDLNATYDKNDVAKFDGSIGVSGLPDRSTYPGS